MNGNNEKKRGEKMMDDFLDAGFESLTALGKDYIRKGIQAIPDIMSRFSNNIKEMKALSVDIKANEVLLAKKMEELFFSCFEDGYEYGEKRKEYVMVEAMKQNGIASEQIQLILKQAKQIQANLEQEKPKKK